MFNTFIVVFNIIMNSVIWYIFIYLKFYTQNEKYSMLVSNKEISFKEVSNE